MAVKASCTVTLSCYRDTQSITRYYKLQSSTSSAPSKPTTNPPTGWDDTEPSYTSGSTNTLYFCDLTVFSDGTWAYSTVSKSSSYEAAKEAYNKAQNAQDTIDGLDIGGRNLLLKTNTVYTNNDYNTATYTPSSPLISGEIYTLSMCVTPASGVESYGLYFSGGYTGVANLYPNGTEKQILTAVFKMRYYSGRTPDDDINYADAKIYRFPDDGTVTTNTTVHWIKIEKGNKATDWSPAPEDLEDGINNAQSSANQAQSDASDAQNRVSEAESLIQKLNDCISMLVTDENGTSLMKQTADGWTFSMEETSRAVSDIANSLDDLIKESSNTQSVVDSLTSAVNDLGELSNYVKIVIEGSQPCIELGTGNSDFKLLITNTAIRFMEGPSEPAYINNKSLYIRKAVITEELQQGNWIWKVRSNGNICIVWNGGES